MEAVFETKPLLGPEQARSMQEDMQAAQATLANPMNDPRVDKGAVQRQLLRLKTDFERQVARPPESPGQQDQMIRRRNQLLSEVLGDGPCSQEEMRKAPPGAVEKHRRWEARNKAKLLEWKNIGKRLHTAGVVEAGAWNFEEHRPTSSSLNMDNAHIPGKQIFMPTSNVPVVTFSAEQLEFLKGLGFEPGLMSNAMRADVKQLVETAKSGIGLDEPKDPVRSEAGKRGAEKKRRIGAAQKAALAQGRATAAANRAAKQAEKP